MCLRFIVIRRSALLVLVLIISIIIVIAFTITTAIAIVSNIGATLIVFVSSMLFISLFGYGYSLLCVVDLFDDSPDC